ncbi:potassium voltage-gated channel subfamily E member 3-like [Hypomesus transpacificus]|uniref:potassium voltage-gated channel subfamily E member 3-like n=1 Tax=Hypomesus transpacificus TaxID=137520 RepID=UPI001F080563|nr:potassium voltage-gated channel subfamily E member 3-like [Hypomesus transpacificus]
MNRTLLLALLTHCKTMILEELDTNIGDSAHRNATASTTPGPLATVSPTSPLVLDLRGSYDNAYFYILFVMFFYSFLALTLFKNFIRSEKGKKDPYEEFMSGGATALPKFNTGPSTGEGFDFEDECIL